MTTGGECVLFEYMSDELDVLAEEIYDWCNARRKDNLNKDGSPGDPRKVSTPYSTSYDQVKHFYRSVASCLQEKFNTTPIIANCHLGVPEHYP